MCLIQHSAKEVGPEGQSLVSENSSQDYLNVIIGGVGFGSIFLDFVV